jgi:hypothetical protein
MINLNRESKQANADLMGGEANRIVSGSERRGAYAENNTML